MIGFTTKTSPYDAGHQIATSPPSIGVKGGSNKIAGIVPAFMCPPYGEYDDQILEVVDIRGQTVVIMAYSSPNPVSFVTDGSFSSSGDFTGPSVTVVESKSRYDDVVRIRPSTLLALNNEVHGKTPFACVSRWRCFCRNHGLSVLPHAIQVLQRAGHRLVMLSECLGR